MHRQALFFLVVLFFMMGFTTCLNDILVPYLKEVFKLGYAEVALIQFCFFAAYGLTSLPSGRYIEKVGYQRAMATGFLLAAVGCAAFFPAVAFNAYWPFLGALFILATGIVLLQVGANPFVAVIGTKETASSRLTMVQAFNSLGTFTAPFFGSFFILSKIVGQDGPPTAVKSPYLFMALAFAIIAVVLMKMKFPEVRVGSDQATWKEVFRAQGLQSGMLGIFAYVGAEVAIGSFLVNYIMNRSDMQETQAAHWVALYWGGAMIGRFIGIYTLRAFRPGSVLATHALAAISLILISINSHGGQAITSIVLVGLCNSVMFPTIFTLSLSKLEERMVHKASGLLGTAITGGALVPLLTGMAADGLGLRIAFLLPAVCYAYIAYFGRRNRI